MNSFLQSQIQGRSANIEQISQMSNTMKADHFDAWKEQVAQDYQGKLEDYANELNRDISKEVAARSEGVSILSNVPLFYQGGKEFYSNLGEYGKMPFDYVGQKIGEYGEDFVNSVAEKAGLRGADIGKFKGIVEDMKEGNYESLASHIKSVGAGNAETSELEMVNFAVGGGGDNTAEMETPEQVASHTPANVQETAGEEDISYLSQPRQKLIRQLNDDIGDEIQPKQPEAQPQAVEEVKSPLEQTTEMPTTEIEPAQVINEVGAEYSPLVEQAAQNVKAAEAAQVATTETAEIGAEGAEGAAVGATEIGAEGAAVGAGIETGALVGDAAIAETGVGLPVAAVGAAIIGIGVGLSELFGHHSHHPSRPTPTLSSGQPFQTTYNLGGAVLATDSSVANARQGTMTF